MALAWLYWDPSRFALTIPGVNIPITWYGILFSFGFLVAFFLLFPLFKHTLKQANPQKSESLLKEQTLFLLDRLTWYAVLGTVIGARLGHVLLYEWPRYQQNPLEIFKVWEGGLASHGGILGVIFAVWLYQRSIRQQFPEFTFLVLLDSLCIPGTFIGMCIRIGNFFNQEIVGVETTVPWGIIFGHPLEATFSVPRHPVQLYEAFAYFLTFLGLVFLWNQKKGSLKSGTLLGTCMLFVFFSRFFLEFYKSPQSHMINETLLNTGQYLSIPFILLGLYLLIFNIFLKQEKLS